MDEKFLDKSGFSLIWSKIKSLLSNKSDTNHTHSDYATTSSVSALEERVLALETALNGFSFQESTSAPTSADDNTITFVDQG